MLENTKVAIQKKKKENPAKHDEQKHNTICVGHHHAQTYTNNLNNAPSHKQLGVKAKRTTMNMNIQI
jgi:hypothetical protein